MNNEELRQSATKAELIFLSSDHYRVRILRANINGITCDITADFANHLASTTFIESFGLIGAIYIYNGGQLRAAYTPAKNWH